MEIIENKQNPFLKRREIKIIVEAVKNPTMQEAVKMVVEQFKAVEDSITIKKIKGKFGRKTFLVEANIYNNKEDKEKIEAKPKVKKQAGQIEEEEKPEKKEEKVEEKK